VAVERSVAVERGDEVARDIGKAEYKARAERAVCLAEFTVEADENPRELVSVVTHRERSPLQGLLGHVLEHVRDGQRREGAS